MKDETGKVIFDTDEQAEVNRVVEERLNRERGKYTDYEDVKGIAEELKAFGYQGTHSEIRQAIKEQREEAQRQQELQELQKQVKTGDTSPELLQLISDLKMDIKQSKAEIADLKKDKEDKIQTTKQADQQKKHMATMISEFEETYPDVDLEKLNADEDFIEFYKDSNPNLTLVKVYERYSKYTHQATEKATAKIQSNLERSTSSGKQKGNNTTFGLSADQRATVDDYNKSCRNPKERITYEEFAQNLRR